MHKQYQIDIVGNGLDVYLETAVLAEDTLLHKPHPDPILECLKRMDLKPEEVTWFTNNPNVALIRNGVVTALGPGTTKVFAKYGDQQVECIVRCNF